MTPPADRLDRGRAMRRWMVAVGIFYLLIGVRLLPFVNGPMIEALGIESFYSGGDLDTGSTAFELLLDWMGTFGLDVAVLGGVMLVASRDPIRNRLFAHLAIWHEIGPGIAADAWLVSRGYANTAFYLGFIAVHLIVVLTGIWVLRRTPRREAPDSEAMRLARA